MTRSPGLEGLSLAGWAENVITTDKNTLIIHAIQKIRDGQEYESILDSRVSSSTKIPHKLHNAR